jgi:glycosyltransferase 2 family protein
MASDADGRPLKYGRDVDRDGAASAEYSSRPGTRHGRPGYDVVPVDGVEECPDRADELDRGLAVPRMNRTRAIVGGVLLTVVFAAVGLAVYRQRNAIADTLRQVGLWPMLLSGLFGLVAMALAFPIWHEVLHGLGACLPWAAGCRVFFVSQLGKYVPGSIWPIVMQVEAGRTHGIRRRTMLAGNLITLVLAVAVGLVLTCALLPAYNAAALGRYWWLLLVFPLLVVLLHPRAMSAILDRLFAVLHRPPLGERLQPRSEVRAVGWSLAYWAALGGHLTVLCAALGHGGPSAFVLCTGGIALAVCAGLLVVPVPAGAGIRDVVLALVLSAILDSGQALAVAIASRVILVCCDVILALGASLIRTRPSATTGETSRGIGGADLG